MINYKFAIRFRKRENPEVSYKGLELFLDKEFAEKRYEKYKKFYKGVIISLEELRFTKVGNVLEEDNIILKKDLIANEDKVINKKK